MTGIYFDEGVSLKSFSAQTKGGKSIIKIELETRDHYDLASVLRQLDNVECEQLARAKATKTPAAKSKKKVCALPAPLLQIPDLREGDDV